MVSKNLHTLQLEKIWLNRTKFWCHMALPINYWFIGVSFWIPHCLLYCGMIWNPIYSALHSYKYKIGGT